MPRLLRLAGTILLIAGVIWGMHTLLASGTPGVLIRADISFVIAAFLAVASAHLALTGRWWSLLPRQFDYPRTLRIYLESHFWSVLVLGGFAKDAYRIVALRRGGLETSHAAASIVSDRAIGTVSRAPLFIPIIALEAGAIGSGSVANLGWLTTIFACLVILGMVAMM